MMLPSILKFFYPFLFGRSKVYGAYTVKGTRSLNQLPVWVSKKGFQPNVLFLSIYFLLNPVITKRLLHSTSDDLTTLKDKTGLSD